MSGKPVCCPNCFGDTVLEAMFKASHPLGTCPVCLSENVRMAPCSEFRDVFGPLINIYVDDDKGRPLLDWLREDWDLFHHPRMEDARANMLLMEVLEDGNILRRRFSPVAHYANRRLEDWETLRVELMHQNRYFPATKIDEDRTAKLLELVEHINSVESWYRARLQSGDTAFELAQMGPPPPRDATHGRANPAGIPYLYLASKPETAVAEIRPHTGDVACVAEFRLPLDPKLELVDLRDPRRTVSPFTFTDEEQIGELRWDLPFLHRLGEELTRPIMPQGAPYDYVPSQFLCEFIKKCGYAGVLYRSSVSDGTNLALFTPAVAIPAAVSRYTVSRVSAEIQPLA